MPKITKAAKARVPRAARASSGNVNFESANNYMSGSSSVSNNSKNSKIKKKFKESSFKKEFIEEIKENNVVDKLFIFYAKLYCLVISNNRCKGVGDLSLLLYLLILFMIKY